LSQAFTLPSRYLDRVRRSRFARNVAVVATGTAAAQAINMAFAPFITRFYGPEAFGLLGIFMALLVILTPIASLTYPIAIVLPKEDNDAKGIAILSAYIAVAVSSVVALVLILGGEQLLALAGAEAIGTFILLIPLAVLFAAFVQIAQQWLIRKQQFSVTAKVTFLQSFMLNSAKVGFGWFYPSGAVLIALNTAGQTLHAAILAMGVKCAGGLTPTAALVAPNPKTSLRELALRYRDFPLYRAPQAFLNPLSQSLPVLLLASFFGPAVAGFYSLARTVMAMPSALISASVGNVLYPRIAEAANKGEKLAPMIIKATLILALIGIVPFGTVVAFGPWLFGFVFGAEWVSAGGYAQWLTIWLFAGFINVPSVQALPVLLLLPYFLVYEIASTVLRLAALLLGFYAFASDMVAIALFSSVSVLLNIALIAVAVSKARHIDKVRLQ
jgi:O-antigen/teichoic acid export membrane protein